MPLMRGAIPSSPHKAYAAFPFQIPPIAIPPTFGVVPKQLSVWGNDTYGDCVTAEEAAAKAMYSVLYGTGTELFIPDSEVISWAKSHGYLNGATLTDVMDDMAKDGFLCNGTTYDDGPYKSVDWTDDATLSAAIFLGPVKIAVAADQLDGITPGTNGWFGIGYRRDHRSDHCVNLCGYGTLGQLADLLKVTPPSRANTASKAYLLYTWGTIGIVDQSSMINITTEAWLRNPTTTGVTPPGPPTPPTPTPPSTGTITIDFDSKVVSVPRDWTVVPYVNAPLVLTGELNA